MNVNPYQSPLSQGETPKTTRRHMPDFAGATGAFIGYSLAGLLCGSLASMIAFWIAGTLDAAPRPLMCGNTMFEMGIPYGFVLGILWGTWKAGERLIAVR